MNRNGTHTLAFAACAGILLSGAFVLDNEARAIALAPRSQVADPAHDPADEPGYTIAGERLDASLLGPGIVESMDVVVARDAALRAAGTLPPPVEHRHPRPRRLGFVSPGSTTSSGGGPAAFVVNPPTLVQNFSGPSQGDPGASLIPPDTCGMVGINHFVTITNNNLSVYVKATGMRVMNVSLGSFWNAGIGGDPRVCFDPSSQRWIAEADDFNLTLYIAVSTTSDPTGTWFKTHFTAVAGSDAGHFPDYPTLGVDANGIYTAAYMVPNPNGSSTMTIFALDKAPLIAASPSLGTITAFRGLPYESANQPCVTFGNPGFEYVVSDQSSTQMRVRRVNPPLTAPTLTNVGSVSVPGHGDPPPATQSGGATRLDTIDTRHINAVFRNGSIWTIQGVSSNNRAAERWYQVNPTGPAMVQQGLINDSTKHYFFGSISVDSQNNVVIGFSASNGSMFGSGWYCGRSASDPAGQVSTPLQYKAGLAFYDPGIGDPTRWGDYSLTSADPVDDSLWTIQEYARTGSDWGTWIAHFGTACGGTPDCNGNGVRDACDIDNGTSLDNNADGIPDECEGFNGSVFCAGDGVDPLVTSLCPCFNFGTPGNGCANSLQAGGASLRASGLTSPSDTLSFTVTSLPPIANVVFVKGSASNTSGSIFGDGIRCVSGSQIRFGTGSAAGGQIIYPDLLQPPISNAGGTPPGSGLTAYYQCFYRNPDPTYCTTATFNISNGFQITW